MGFLLLSLFLLLVAAIIVRGLFDYKHLISFPLFVAVGAAGYMLPQIIGLWGTSYAGTPAFNAFLFIAVTSIACAMVGYSAHINDSSASLVSFSLSDAAVFRAAIVYTIVSLYFFVRLYSLPEAELNQQQWSGRTVAFLFFARLIYVGYALALIAVLRRMTGTRLLFVLGLAAFIVISLALRARRTEIGVFVGATLIIVYFVRGITVPRWVLAALAAGMILFSAGIHQYRQYVAKQFVAEGRADWSRVREINYFDSFKERFSPEKAIEVRFGVTMIQTAMERDVRGYGTAYWNRLIFQFVPAQIVGRRLKESLYLPAPDVASMMVQSVGYSTLQAGIFQTSPAELYIEFSYLGGLVFYLLGMFMKGLTVSASRLRSDPALVAYALLAPYGIIAIISGTTIFAMQAVYYFAFLAPLAYFGTRVFQGQPVQRPSSPPARPAPRHVPQPA